MRSGWLSLWSKGRDHGKSNRTGRCEGALPHAINTIARSTHPGSVANFAQDVMRGQLSLSVGGLRGQSVELFGRSEAFVSGPDQQLFLLDHVHELDPNEGVLGCLERFEP